MRSIRAFLSLLIVGGDIGWAHATDLPGVPAGIGSASFAGTGAKASGVAGLGAADGVGGAHDGVVSRKTTVHCRQPSSPTTVCTEISLAEPSVGTSSDAK